MGNPFLSVEFESGVENVDDVEAEKEMGGIYRRKRCFSL